MVPLVPWASGVRDQFLTISTEKVEGQLVSGPAARPSTALRAAPAT
jgi:hypothetical protein